MKEKICVFSVKIIAEIFGTDDILVDKIKFAQMFESTSFTKAFEKVRRIIKQRAAQRGYPQKNGYRFQYHIYSPLRKLWEGTL